LNESLDFYDFEFMGTWIYAVTYCVCLKVLKNVGIVYLILK